VGEAESEKLSLPRSSYGALRLVYLTRRSRSLAADARYVGPWELPVIGAVNAPGAVLIRPDGYVAWVGEQNQLGLIDALSRWFGPPAAA
jgi:hypothetical protein